MIELLKILLKKQKKKRKLKDKSMGYIRIQKEV